MRRRTQANPMRLLIMLAVMWAAGSWLFAAETSPSARARPAAQAQPQAAALAAEEGANAPATTDPVDEPAEPTTAAQDTKEASDASDERDASAQSKEADDDKAATAKTEDATEAGASPRRFVPSEQVRADFDVSFPIDI